MKSCFRKRLTRESSREDIYGREAGQVEGKHVLEDVLNLEVVLEEVPARCFHIHCKLVHRTFVHVDLLER